MTALIMSGAIRELLELRKQREYQLFHDLLTGLPNRALSSSACSNSSFASRGPASPSRCW
jgi:GGDEF domain-containing protein